jgi:outer membrane protein TolC
MEFSAMRVKIALFAAAFAAATVSAFAQSAQPTLGSTIETVTARMALVPEAPQAPAEPTGPVRRISIDDAVRLALEQNLGIRIQRIDPQVQDLGIAQARSAWVPTLSTTFGKNSTSSQVTNALAGGASSVDNGTLSSQFTVTQSLPWGGSYTGTFNNSRVTTSNLFASYSPQLNSGINLQYSQPLLRNYSIDQIRQSVQTSAKVRELSDIQLQTVITQTTRAVKDAYWDLSAAISNLKAQQQSLALSQQSLKDETKRVEIGTKAPIDIVQAQAEVASNEQGVIVADATIRTAQDNLRALVLDPSTPDFWTLTFDPTDAPSFSTIAIDVEAAVRNAIDKRSDIAAAKNNIQQSDINLKYFTNQIKPDVNAQVTYNAAAAGGTPLASTVSVGGLTNQAPQRGYGTVLGDVFSGAFPAWTVGVQVGYPIGQNLAHANLARARLQYEQSQVQMKNLEMQITTQIRLAARNVNTNAQRVQAARASRELQERKLEAEEKKLAAGMSSSFFVFQAQRDLALARVVEIQAISDYNKSLVDFEAVQLVPLGGGAGGVTIAGR